MGKGTRGERWLVNYVEDELGHYAQRTGASGGATDRNRPDVIMAAPGYLYFVEIKNRGDPTQRFKKEEVEDLIEAAERAGAIPVLMARVDLRKYDHHHCFFPEELKENEKSYSATQKELPGHPVESLFTDG